ncbi:hypothetical protein A4A49_51910 [Nicotiana attenuata]|uniref:RNase H type-1 domain-containing protein n=1 Tax=Nicotiana attenuata TaxID=49451 RepID=A0A314L1N4_NICAT|nr:hypothetical protein A4A49_51910 [Nicotiana attenuata]
MSIKRVIHKINTNIYHLAKVRYLWFHDIPFQWPHMVKFFECDIDGASKGNPGSNSAACCVRKFNGDLSYAKARRLGVTTHKIAEAVAIKEGLKYCKLLDGLWEVPWCLVMEMHGIKHLRRRGLAKFAHEAEESRREEIRERLSSFLKKKLEANCTNDHHL